MVQTGKRQKTALQMVDRARAYTLSEAVQLAKKVPHPKFDETVELHFRMGVDPRNAEQQVRGTALLPHGLGKVLRVLVFAQGEAASLAEQASADYVGADDLIARIEGGWLEFDVAIATPDLMGKIGKLGRILGRRGLMPNPRAGTIAQPQDLARVIQDARKGRVEFRLDRSGLIHVPVGKLSFDDQKLIENIATMIDAVVKARPSGVKGQFVRSLTVCSTMGPGIPLDVAAATAVKLE